MAFRDMSAEIRGWIAKLSLPLSETLINEALQKIYDESLWSFLLGESGWFTPSLVSAGTITTTLGTNQVVGNATAAAAWIAISAPFLITSMQIRLPAYALYNVVGFDGVNTLTLDRNWMEPAGAGQSYNLYQAYYPAPVADFRRWISVRDFTNAIPLNFWGWKQQDLAIEDPQRTVFENPTHVVPYETDNRLNSSTLGYMLFELYPHPLSQLPYALAFLRRGTLLVNPTDTLPYPLTEDLVKNRARTTAYEWAEANKSRYPELQKTSWQFLMKQSTNEYNDRLKEIRKIDRDLVDNFVSRLRRNDPQISGSYYNAITGQASVGF